MNCSDTDLRIIVLGCFQVEDAFSSFAALRLPQLFKVRVEAPFLHASGKQWRHDGGWNLTFTIACIILHCLYKLCCKENPFKFCKQSW